MMKVEKSIDLGQIITLVRENRQIDFWYVDRRARLLEFKIILLRNQRNNFGRITKVYVACYHVLKNKNLFTNEKHTAGPFFDKYFKKGHFFSNKSDAAKYMNKRIQTGRSDIVKSAKTFIEEHPEYLI